MGKLYYCPRCGSISKEKDHLNNPKCSCTSKQNNSSSIMKIFSRGNIDNSIERIKSNEEYKDLFVGTDPRTSDGITLKMHEVIWENYVDIPENDKLDRASFEEYKHSIKRLLRGNKGKVEPMVNLTPRQSQQPKDASVIGRGVVGGIAAGPVGAVVGALSAVDKNNRNKK